MEKSEKLIIGLLLMMMLLVPGIIIGDHSKTDDFLHARIPENGNWSMNTIKVNTGESMILSIMSEDVVHSFVAPDFNISVRLFPGDVRKIEIYAQYEGVFQFYCDIVCSPKHVNMVGDIIVS